MTAARATGPNFRAVWLAGGAALVVALVCAGSYYTVSHATVAAADPVPTFTDKTIPDDQSTDDQGAQPDPSVIESDLLGTATNINAPTWPDPSEDGSGTTTTFTPLNMLDGQPETAWRMAGDGTGRTITVRWDSDVTITSVGLINGYAKVDSFTQDDRYQEERRITRVTWSVDDQEVLTTDLTDGDRSIQSQPLSSPVTGTVLSLRIDEVTLPGDSARDWTAISDIEVLGQ